MKETTLAVTNGVMAGTFIAIATVCFVDGQLAYGLINSLTATMFALSAAFYMHAAMLLRKVSDD